MSTAKFSTWLNPDGTENYKCRAWVNFNGTGTVAIRAAGNVSSITDNGVGYYTVNFTTAMPDANYCIVGTGEENRSFALQFATTPTTTSCQMAQTVTSSFAPSDTAYLGVAIFR
jgi:hypothetical protein